MSGPLVTTTWPCASTRLIFDSAGGAPGDVPAGNAGDFAAVAPGFAGADLLLVIPFETVARGHDIARGGQLTAAASDDGDRLVDVVDRPIANHGLLGALQRDVALRLDPVDLGIAAGIAAFCFAIVRDQ